MASLRPEPGIRKRTGPGAGTDRARRCVSSSTRVTTKTAVIASKSFPKYQNDPTHHPSPGPVGGSPVCWPGIAQAAADSSQPDCAKNHQHRLDAWRRQAAAAAAPAGSPSHSTRGHPRDAAGTMWATALRAETARARCYGLCRARPLQVVAGRSRSRLPRPAPRWLRACSLGAGPSQTSSLSPAVPMFSSQCANLRRLFWDLFEWFLKMIEPIIDRVDAKTAVSKSSATIGSVQKRRCRGGGIDKESDVGCAESGFL